MNICRVASAGRSDRKSLVQSGACLRKCQVIEITVRAEVVKFMIEFGSGKTV